MTLKDFVRRVVKRITRACVDFIPDEVYLKCMFRINLGYPLNLDNPRSYNEKLQWLKLHDRHPEYTKMVDKVDAKRYVASIVGEKYLIPTLGIWNSVDEIEWNSLPMQFVVKVTSDSGSVVVCKDKTTFDIPSAKKKLTVGWGKNYSKYNKEYPYFGVMPRIIVEQYLEDESGYELKDYKIFCFDGKARFLFVATDRFDAEGETKFDFYDLEWNHIPVRNGHPNNPVGVEKPRNFEEMIDVAERLSAGMPHVRVDLYNCNGKIYFGEMTFFHWSGMTPFVPEEWDYKFGEYLTLPK